MKAANARERSTIGSCLVYETETFFAEPKHYFATLSPIAMSFSLVRQSNTPREIAGLAMQGSFNLLTAAILKLFPAGMT